MSNSSDQKREKGCLYVYIDVVSPGRAAEF